MTRARPGAQRPRSPRAPALVLAGCVLSCAMVKPEPFVEKVATAREDVGYIAAYFSVESDNIAFFFGIEDAQGQRRDMAFRDPSERFVLDTTHPANSGLTRSKEVGMIALPPGEYRIAYWRIGDVGPMAEPRSVSRRHAMANWFTVLPGHVVFLGSFVVQETYDRVGNLVTIKSSVEPQRLPSDAAWRLLTGAYPGFTNTPIECLLCSAPEGTPSASPALRKSAGAP